MLADSVTDYEKARDTIAGRITQNRGEYIIRFGQHPTRFRLFAIEKRESLSDVNLSPCSVDDLKRLQAGLLRVAEEIGAKVCLYHHICVNFTQLYRGFNTFYSARSNSPGLVSIKTPSY